MNIKFELLKNEISELITKSLPKLNIDADKIADTAAITMLSEIQEILKKNMTDFETVEEIVCVFERYGLDFGECHDFS